MLCRRLFESFGTKSNMSFWLSDSLLRIRLLLILIRGWLKRGKLFLFCFVLVLVFFMSNAAGETVQSGCRTLTAKREERGREGKGQWEGWEHHSIAADHISTRWLRPSGRGSGLSRSLQRSFTFLPLFPSTWLLSVCVRPPTNQLIKNTCGGHYLRERVLTSQAPIKLFEQPSSVESLTVDMDDGRFFSVEQQS